MPLIDPGADVPAPAPEPVAAAPPVSRLCVKNLPKHCDEKRLRQHFAQSGEGDVTDVRVMRTKLGKSRLFGFVGFRTPQAAAAAQKHFARSFIDTSRITIEASKPMGDDSLARPWSRYSQGSSAWAKKNPEVAKAAADEAKAKAAAAGGGGGGGDGKKRPSTHEGELQAKLQADPKLAPTPTPTPTPNPNPDLNPDLNPNPNQVAGGPQAGRVPRADGLQAQERVEE